VIGLELSALQKTLDISFASLRKMTLTIEGAILLKKSHFAATERHKNLQFAL
jgi:hypothetical protein